jgi:hypothetical protein
MIVETTEERVEIVVLPIFVSGFGPLDLLVCLQFVLMILKVSTSDDIVISEAGSRHLLDFLLLFLFGFRVLLRGSIMMLGQGEIRKYIIVGVGLGRRTEVPGFLLWVVWAVLQPF